MSLRIVQVGDLDTRELQDVRGKPCIVLEGTRDDVREAAVLWGDDVEVVVSAKPGAADNTLEVEYTKLAGYIARGDDTLAAITADRLARGGKVSLAMADLLLAVRDRVEPGPKAAGHGSSRKLG